MLAITSMDAESTLTVFLVFSTIMSTKVYCLQIGGLKESIHARPKPTVKGIRGRQSPWNSIGHHTPNLGKAQGWDPMNIQVPDNSPRIFYPMTNGADPNGGSDSTAELQLTINQAFEVASTDVLMDGVVDLGGVEVHLGGGQYVISKPLTIPDIGGGNVVIHGGTVRASNSFPADGFLLEMATTTLREEWTRVNGRLTESLAQPIYENVHLHDLLLDANYTGGGILLLNPLRVTISNCYITHFSTIGISVQGGHETLIHSSFLGQHITSGADPLEHTFSGTAILLSGNDNSVTDVVIFSAQTAIEVDGQANIITNAHCYNKASGLGGIGIVIRKGATLTRILGCYLDFTGIVLEETAEIIISNSFFLGDAYVLLKAIGDSPATVTGLNIAENIFHGNNNGVPIVQLQGNFSDIRQTCIDNNSATGMVNRCTRARATVTGYGSEWTVDFSQRLLFPSSIAHVHYSFYALPGREDVTHNSSGKFFPLHALHSVTSTSIKVTSDTPINATVSIYVDQSFQDEDTHDSFQPYLSS